MEHGDAELWPGRRGERCPGNGKTKGIECLCDECDFMLCCLDTHDDAECINCTTPNCPRREKQK